MRKYTKKGALPSLVERRCSLFDPYYITQRMENQDIIKNEKQWNPSHPFVQYRESEIAFLLKISILMPEL